MSPEETFKRISDLLTNDGDLRKYDPKLQVDFDSTTRSGTATGSMFNARLSVAQDDAGSRVELIVDLPNTMSMKLMKGVIESKLRSKVDEILA